MVSDQVIDFSYAFVDVCCHRIPGQYFTADSSWSVVPVNVSIKNQQIYIGSELICKLGPIILPQDAALYDDHVKEIMLL